MARVTAAFSSSSFDGAPRAWDCLLHQLSRVGKAGQKPALTRNRGPDGPEWTAPASRNTGVDSGSIHPSRSTGRSRIRRPWCRRGPATSCGRRTRKGPTLATSSRRIVGFLIALLLPLGAVTALSAPAQAEEGYRYWNYFHLQNGAWTFSDVGPGQHRPKDGTVEGFRFGTSTTNQGVEPRADLSEVTFETVCGQSEAAGGEKRVAVVIDYGVDEGAGTPPEPRADCAVVPEDATTQKVLGDVAEVRQESAMVCALDGYPASGCGEPVADAKTPTEEKPVSFELPAAEQETDAAAADGSGTTDAADPAGSSDTPWGLIGLGALVVLIAGGGFLVARRNRP